MDDWQRLAASGVTREEILVPSQSVTGEKYLATEVQWSVGCGWRLPSET